MQPQQPRMLGFQLPQQNQMFNWSPATNNSGLSFSGSNGVTSSLNAHLNQGWDNTFGTGNENWMTNYIAQNPIENDLFAGQTLPTNTPSNSLFGDMSGMDITNSVAGLGLMGWGMYNQGKQNDIAADRLGMDQEKFSWMKQLHQDRKDVGAKNTQAAQDWMNQHNQSTVS